MTEALSKYRPDLDGLRAVAVLSTMAFHAFPATVSGGFIGVDIFYVISGFLITTILLKSTSLASFYGSRIRRIFPSMVVVMLASLTFGWFALLPDEYAQLGKHTAASAAFLTNMVLADESGYFDGAAITKPLLHLWSLGVEIQFYLLWPLLLIGLLRIRRDLYASMALLGLTSFGASLLLMRYDAIDAFYLPYARFWELWIGALLACPRMTVPVRVQHGCSLLGAGLITLGLATVSQHNFPGWPALLPVLGAACIIVAGPQAVVNRMLAKPLMVWLGLISFPLYLWHWPMLSFAHIIVGDSLPVSVRFVLLLAAVPLAWLTYRLLEIRIRHGGQRQQKVLALLLLMGLCGLAGFGIYDKLGLPQRYPIRTMVEQFEQTQFPPLHSNHEWYCDRPELQGVYCFQDRGATPTAVVVGDSHAPRIYAGLKTLYAERGKALGMLADNSCPPFFGLISKMYANEVEKRCLNTTTRALEVLLADSTVQEVILVNRGALYTSQQGFGEIAKDHFATWTLQLHNAPDLSNMDAYSHALTDTLTRFTQAGKQVTYVHNVPELGFDIKSCMGIRPLRTQSRNPCGVSKAEFLARHKQHRAMVNAVLSQFPEVRAIDPAQALCDEEYCYGMREGKLLYEDDDHLSLLGSHYVIQQLKDQFAP